MLILENLILLSSMMAQSGNLSNSTVKYIDYITSAYFSKNSVLLINLANTSLNSKEFYIKFLASSEILTLELCDVSYMRDEGSTNRSYVKYTLILLNDVIPSEEDIQMMRNCKSWNSGSRIVVLLHDKDENIVKNLLMQFWTLTKAINVTVMLIVGTSVKFYTLQPYKKFIMEELTIENLFPNKIPKNFNGSIITAITAQYKPLVIESNGQYEGIEPRIINTISKHLNFGIKYKHLPPGENPFLAKKINGRITGTFGLLDRLEVDIVFHACLVIPVRMAIGDLIAVHIIDDIIWVLPTYPFTFDWKSLFDEFLLELWLLLLLVLISVLFVIFILTKPGYDSFTFIDAFFQTLSHYLWTPITYRHNGLLYRMFMILFAFFALNIMALYQSCLIRFLTTPRLGKEYGSSEEALDDGLIVSLYPGVDYNLTYHNFWNKALVPGRHIYSVDFDHLLRVLVHNKTIFFRGTVINTKYLLNDYYLKEGEIAKVQIMDDMREIFIGGFFTSKNHPLLRVLQMYIMRLVEGGFVRFWAREYMFDKDIDESDGDPFPLSFVHLKGIFLVWAGLLMLSFFIFLCEFIYLKKWGLSEFNNVIGWDLDENYVRRRPSYLIILSRNRERRLRLPFIHSRVRAKNTLTQ